MIAAELALSEALAARLCHDLAGLAGTVGHMLELVDDDPQQAAEAMPLARDAAAGLQRRLRLARAAWGCVDDWPPGGWPELVAAMATDRLRVDLDAAAMERGRPAPIGRLLLNVALLGAERLGGRGNLAFRGATGDVAAILTSPPAEAAAQWPALRLGDPATARSFLSVWTARLAQSCGAALHPDGLVLRIVLPA